MPGLALSMPGCDNRDVASRWKVQRYTLGMDRRRVTERLRPSVGPTPSGTPKSEPGALDLIEQPDRIEVRWAGTSASGHAELRFLQSGSAPMRVELAAHRYATPRWERPLDLLALVGLILPLFVLFPGGGGIVLVSMVFLVLSFRASKARRHHARRCDAVAAAVYQRLQAFVVPIEGEAP